MTDQPFKLKSSLPVDPKAFPSTRYQGSKRKLAAPLFDVFKEHTFSNALDLYSGTGTVSLLMRYMGKSVHSNDLLSFNATASFLLLHATTAFLRESRHEKTLVELLSKKPLSARPLVSELYDGIFFKNDENLEIDRFCQNVAELPLLDRALYIYCVGQALLMKRPYNLFHRANLSMRTSDVERSFGNAKTWERPIAEHATKILYELRRFPFPEFSQSHKSTCVNADSTHLFRDDYDLVYLDPPYLNKKSQGVDYCDFYHFLEGLVEYSRFGDSDLNYPHRPIVKGRSPWLSLDRAIDHLSRVVEKFSKATFVLSYRLDGQPTASVITEIFARYGRQLREAASESYKYALSNSQDTQEAILVALPADKVRGH